MEGKPVIARWVSRSGKHWVEVYADGSYLSPSAGGTRQTAFDAVEHVQRLVEAGGYFQPDDARTPMRRTI